MTEQEQTVLVATEIMEWASKIYRGGVAVWDRETGNHVLRDDDEYWDPRTRWDHAGMLAEKICSDRDITMTLRYKRYATVAFEKTIVYKKSGWRVACLGQASCPTVPAAIFAAALATLEDKP